MIEKIIKVISNLKILSKMNEIIDGLNTHAANTNNPHNVTAEQLGLATAYVYKGSVTNFSDLPTNAQNGWVYSVENEHTDSAGILHPAGANFAWNGSKWDDLGGSLSGYTKSVNSQSPDNKGNVKLTLVKSLEKNTEDKLVVHNSDGSIQELEVGKKYTINNNPPDSNDNYDINEFEGYWESNESVSVGDVRFLKGRNNTKYLLECVQSGVTGTEQPTISEDVILADYSDNTRIGTMRLIFNIAEKDDNEILATGILYTRAVYTELWDYISSKTGLIISEDEWQLKYQQTGGKFVPYYSSGDGISTFRTPLLNAYARGTDSVDNVGSYLAAGLPNFKGGFGFGESGLFTAAYGDVRGTASKNKAVPPSSTSVATSYSQISINLSNASSIYGNSDTVQPESMIGMWVIKAFGIVTNDGNIDLNNILSGITELENRVTPISKGGTGATTSEQARENLGLGSMALEDNAIVNATISGKVITLTFADGTTKSLTMQGAAFMPNYGSYVQISTGDYTPTSNGIIIVNHTHDGDYQTVKVVHKSSGLEIFRDTQARYPGDFTSWCLVAKSETYTISVSGGSSTVYFCPMKEG